MQYDKQVVFGARSLMRDEKIDTGQNQTSGWRSIAMDQNSAATDCADICCRDWCCIAFNFHTQEDTGSKTCVLLNYAAPLIESPEHTTTVSAVRAHLPAKTPPYKNSTAIPPLKDGSGWGVFFEQKMYIGIQGDYHPTTWASDGHQYAGTGDNSLDNPSHKESPDGFLRISGGPTDVVNKDTAFLWPSGAEPISGPVAIDACKMYPQHGGTANTKPSAVLAINETLYWAVSCFNYGDDQVFNRQRWGPTWIVTSDDYGKTWNLTASPRAMFKGKLGGPRIVQFGQGYKENKDGFVYAMFPATMEGSAFLEQNDAIWLGRVPATELLVREKWEFFVGVDSGGVPRWSSDETIAEPVFEFPLMTSTAQVNWDPHRGRFVFANWAWISADGNPRPDHSTPRLAIQRTQLTLWEAEQLHGPWSLFFRDDDFRGPDGSGGHYGVLFPPAWQTQNESWATWTQCCDWQNKGGGGGVTPINHYNFVTQKMVFRNE